VHDYISELGWHMKVRLLYTINASSCIRWLFAYVLVVAQLCKTDCTELSFCLLICRLVIQAVLYD
jgi:hypothetical protein